MLNESDQMADPSVPRSDFYVYALFREDGVTPFYIGKGRANRIFHHERDAHKFDAHKDRVIRKILAAGLEVPKLKLSEGLFDAAAKQIERDLIQLIGRWPKGPLTNLTSGGDGVSDLSPESRAVKSAKNRAAWNNPVVRERRIAAMKKAHSTPEYLAKNRARLKELHANPEIRARNTEAVREALKRPEVIAARAEANRRPESREKKRAATQAQWDNPETRAKRSAVNSAMANRPETKARQRDASLRRRSSEEWSEFFRGVSTSYWQKNPMPPEEKAIRKARITSPEVLAKSHATNLLPEVRARRIAAQKAAFATPEAKARRSAAQKLRWKKWGKSKPKHD